jgi:uncharacterized cupredoxin-like copper-binding protein
MRRLAAATSILAIGLLAVGGSASATLAQDASSTTAESPVVGAWLLDVGNDPGSPPTTAIFHADGTYIQTDGVGTGIGSWAATGPTTGDLTFTAYGPDETGALWSTTLRGSLEILADDTLSGTFSLEYVGPDGSLTGQYGPATATGTRIAIEPMGSDLTPMGPEPSDAASATSQTLDITLADFSVAISPTTVKAGQPITFVVTNSGAVMHEMVLEMAGDDDVPLAADGVESEIEDIAPGATAEMTWTITEPGTYQLACHVPGHFEQGMVTTFEVVE